MIKNTAALIRQVFDLAPYQIFQLKALDMNKG